MTPLIISIAVYGLVCIAIGYGAGAQRAFAYLGYAGERLGTILATLKPMWRSRPKGPR